MSDTLADLEIATFAIDEVVEGAKTGRDGRQLVVSSPQLAVGVGEPALAEATVEVVRPGDPVRISNVLDVVLPELRVDDPRSTFPGAWGSLAPAGRGRRARLSGVAVVSCCDWEAASYTAPNEFPDSIIDMAGPGAERSLFGATTNLIIRFVPVPGAPLRDADRAVRRSTLATAASIAGSAISETPDAVDTLRPPHTRIAGDLPTIVGVLQVASEGPLLDTFLYGSALGGLVPTVVAPLDILGGALTNGAYDWAAVRNLTWHYQSSALITNLLSEHGRTIRFGGLILAPGYLSTAFDKQRSAIQSASLARLLGADGAICTTFSSGNSHTDTMLTVRALEHEGIGCVAIVVETNGGLTDHVPEADCLVSTGNEDELVAPWTPSRVVGGEGPARVGEPVPMWAYVGACVQTGDNDWTAVPA